MRPLLTSRTTFLVVLMLLVPLTLAATAGATHNNKGTVKVHDDAAENPERRNVPHVTCDFFVEGFMMSDDAGWLKFLGWPPTGNKSEVTPTGDTLVWTADSGDEPGEYHFMKGPYFLPEGHYRVEVYTVDEHPGSGHFAKTKTFWVDPCDQPAENPPCPPDVTAQATPGPAIELSWSAVAGVDGYNVYRAVGEADFEYLATTTETSFTDEDVEQGVTYHYYVTSFEGNSESVDCEPVTVTAIPFFGGMLLGALALVGSIGAYAWFRRR